MKNIKYLFLAALGAVMVSSCSNDMPEFKDSDAFVAFTQTAVSKPETCGEIQVPVMLTSLSGKEATISFEIDSTSTAQEGVLYKIEGEKTLTFTKDEPLQYITVKVIDNDLYEGDKNVVLNLVSDGSSVNLGADKSCTVTIEDDEHPLSDILGSYACTGESYFNGMVSWEVTLSKDASDPTIVWISNMVPNGSSLPVYGKVSDDKTTITVPCEQEIASSSSYPHILLLGFEGVDGEEDATNLIGYISNGTITFPNNWYGSCVFTDDACQQQAGWYEIITSGSVWTKK